MRRSKLFFVIPVLIALFIIGPGIAESFFWGSIKYGVIDLERIEAEAEGFSSYREELERLQQEFQDFREQVLAEHARAVKELTKEFTEKTGGDDGTKQPVLDREYTRRAEQLANEAQEKLDRKQEENQQLIKEKEKKIRD